jgi:hypothetical protein
MTNAMPNRLQVRKGLIANGILFLAKIVSVRFRTVFCPVVNRSCGKAAGGGLNVVLTFKKA